MTMLVALVAMPAQAAASECEALLEEPSRAPSHADRAAEWPRDVAISLAEVVKGLTFARSARNRMPLATALASHFSLPLLAPVPDPASKPATSDLHQTDFTDHVH